MASHYMMPMEEHDRLMHLLGSRNREIDLKGRRLRETQAELTEARSEIARHHDLIEELRDGLTWALDLLRDSAAWGRDERYDELRRLLNREVG